MYKLAVFIRKSFVLYSIILVFSSCNPTLNQTDSVEWKIPLSAYTHQAENTLNPKREYFQSSLFVQNDELWMGYGDSLFRIQAINGKRLDAFYLKNDEKKFPIHQLTQVNKHKVAFGRQELINEKTNFHYYTVNLTSQKLLEKQLLGENFEHLSIYPLMFHHQLNAWMLKYAERRPDTLQNPLKTFGIKWYSPDFDTLIWENDLVACPYCVQKTSGYITLFQPLGSNDSMYNWSIIDASSLDLTKTIIVSDSEQVVKPSQTEQVVIVHSPHYWYVYDISHQQYCWKSSKRAELSRIGAMGIDTKGLPTLAKDYIIFHEDLTSVMAWNWKTNEQVWNVKFRREVFINNDKTELIYRDDDRLRRIEIATGEQLNMPAIDFNYPIAIDKDFKWIYAITSEVDTKQKETLLFLQKIAID